MTKKRRLIPAVIAVIAAFVLVRLGPTIAGRIASDLRWRSHRVSGAIRGRFDPRVSIVADMGQPPHRVVIWTGFASEAEEVRSKLPGEFGRTWISPER